MAIVIFRKGKYPLETLNLGRYKIVNEWLEKHQIIPDKMEGEVVGDELIYHIDVDGDVILNGYNLDDVKNIPYYIRFRHVRGSFILTNKK
jgi:hypothetical protein